MELTEEKLLEKKKEIEDAKGELNSLKGQKKVYEKQLKEDWDCDNLQQAKKKITDMKEKSTKLDEEIEEALQDIEEKYFKEEE